MRTILGPACALLVLVGCPASPSTTASGDDTSGDDTAGEEDFGEDQDRSGAFLRAGLITPGEYLFEIAGAEGGGGRQRGTMIGIGGDDLVVRIDGTTRHVSRQSAWPMMCLRSALTIEDGDLRIALAAGAPVYVVAADASSARVGPVPDVGHGRVIDRSQLSLEGCTEGVGADAPRRVGTPRAGDEACVFPDQDPADESDGLAIATGAPLEVLQEDGAWARVRVSRPGGTIEGWMDARLLSDPERDAGDPDWCACALRPDRCVFPARAPSEVQSRAWVEGSWDDVPLPAAAPFENALLAADARIRACWDEMPADRRPTQTARVEIRLEVDGDGQVSGGAVVRSTRAPESVSRCILERASRVRFPAARSGVTLRRTYAFDPSPATDTGDLEDE